MRTESKYLIDSTESGESTTENSPSPADAGLSDLFYRLGRSEATTFLRLLREDFQRRQRDASQPDQSMDASGGKVWKP